MKSVRKSLIYILSVVFLLCAFMLSVKLNLSVTASVEAGPEIYVEDRASVRLTEDGTDSGLRFKAGISEAYFDFTIDDSSGINQ